MINVAIVWNVIASAKMPAMKSAMRASHGRGGVWSLAGPDATGHASHPAIAHTTRHAAPHVGPSHPPTAGHDTRSALAEPI